jgi:hypothetical protein
MENMMTTKTTTAKDIRENLICDSASKRGNVFTVRKGFFYTGGATAENFVARVKEAFPTAVVVDKGEVWKPFKGGASVAQQSHWFVSFTL